MPGIVDPQYAEWLAFSGTSVTLDGEQHYLDSHLSYQRACLHAIDYLTKFGYSRHPGLHDPRAPRRSRAGCPGVVDIPNSCSTVYIPHRDLRLRRPAVRKRTASGAVHHGRAEGQLRIDHPPVRSCPRAAVIHDAAGTARRWGGTCSRRLRSAR